MTAAIEDSSPDRILAVLSQYVSPIIAKSVLRVALKRCNLPDGQVDFALSASLVHSVEGGLGLYIAEPSARSECSGKLLALLGGLGLEPHAMLLRNESDVVEARSIARRMAAEVGFARTEQIKISTAVSELARNAVAYAGGGEVCISPLAPPRPGIRVEVNDSGPGIAQLELVLSGKYRSKTGLGLGIIGCKRLMDEFELESAPGRGTRASMKKYVP